MSFTAKWKGGLEAAMRKLGQACARKPWIPIVAGVIIGIILCIGMIEIETENDLEDLWIESGSIAEKNKEVFDDLWGGIPRKQLLILTEKDGSSILTKKGLDAFRVATGPTLQGELKSADQVSGAVDVSAHDLCEAPEVPSVFKPWSTVSPIRVPPGTTLPLPGAVPLPGGGTTTELDVQPLVDSCTFLAQGAVVSWAYTKLTQCLPLPSSVPLEDGWGIDRFPCTRASALDCFAEGSHDYPANMKRLEQVDGGVPLPLVVQVATSSRTSPAEYEGCLDSVTRHMARLIDVCTPLPGTLNDILTAQATGDAAGGAAAVGALVASLTSPLSPTAQGTAAAVRASLHSSAQGFQTWGYWWRVSYTTQLGGDAVKIAAHMRAAVGNTRNPAVSIRDCINPESPAFGQCCINWSGRKVDDQLTMGGMSGLEDGGDFKVDALRLVLNNLNTGHPLLADRLAARNSSSEQLRDDTVKEWETGFIKEGVKLQDELGALGIQVEYWSGRSQADMIADANSIDPVLIVVGYVVMVVFACGTFVLDGNGVVSAALGVGGVLVLLLSTVASFGLMGYCKVPLSPIASNVIPFLSLGLGLDDMFVLAYALLDALRTAEGDGEDKETPVVDALALAGPSVLLTSLCNITAFMLASIFPVPIITWFAYGMAISVSTNLVLLLLVYVPFMALYSKHLAPARPKSERDDTGPGMVARFVRSSYAPLLSQAPVKAAVLVLFVVGTAVLGWAGFEKVESGLRNSQVAVKGSHQKSYTKIQEDLFTGYDSYLVARGDFSDPAVQQAVLDTQEELQGSDWLSVAIRVRDLSFLADGTSSYLYGANCAALPAGACLVNSSLITRPVDDFYSNPSTSFARWVAGSGAVFGGMDLVCEDSSGGRVACTAPAATLVAAKTTVYLRNLEDTDDFVSAIKDTRARVDLTLEKSLDYDAFVTGFPYFFWEQYVNIDKNLVFTGGITLLGVFLVVLVMEMDVLVAGVVGVVLLATILEVYGLMAVIGANLTGFSVANLVAAVGMAVELSAHTARAFAVAEGTNDERMALSLESMVVPVTSGFLSSFLAVIPLVGAEFPFFKTYYFGMYSCLLSLAWINGLVVLPVILSLVGGGLRSRGESGEGKEEDTSV